MAWPARGWRRAGALTLSSPQSRVQPVPQPVAQEVERRDQHREGEGGPDDLEGLGIIKVDVLGLGMLTCIRKAFELAKQHYDLNLTLANVPPEDEKGPVNIAGATCIGE